MDEASCGGCTGRNQMRFLYYVGYVYCISLLKLTVPQTVGEDGDVRESTQLDQRKVLLSYPVLFLGK